MDEPSGTEPSSLRPAAAQQRGAPGPTTNRPEPTIPATELRQLPTPTAHVGPKPTTQPRDADSQHCAKHGANCATKYAAKRQEHDSDPQPSTNANEPTNDTESNKRTKTGTKPATTRRRSKTGIHERKAPNEPTNEHSQARHVAKPDTEHASHGQHAKPTNTASKCWPNICPKHWAENAAKCESCQTTDNG